MRGYYEDVHRYDDMLSMPHHRSTKHVHMALYDRAAQFAPFAALIGHEEALRETEQMAEIVNDSQILREQIEEMEICRCAFRN